MYFLTAIKRLTISQDRLSHRNDEAKAKKHEHTHTHTPMYTWRVLLCRIIAKIFVKSEFTVQIAYDAFNFVHIMASGRYIA